ncbi:hypothetical protein ACQP25_22545 [Microtetraspora malaysiensis]|uniref:hypothetical protein n=1 Tax=Microtetraspora malaysiensis TaxID=161358 RepID=UPI003D940203
MRHAIQLFGLYLVVAGISGTIDRLAAQPFLGAILNFFNRVVVPRVDLFTGYEVYANLGLALLGGVIVVAADDRKTA